MTDAHTFTITLVDILDHGCAGSHRRHLAVLDTGVDEGTAWRGNGFNDASWKSGVGTSVMVWGMKRPSRVLGRTRPTNSSPLILARVLCSADVSLLQTLAARLVRDDGAIVYLNNTEVWRDNMPAGTVSFTNVALSPITGTNQTQFLAKVLSPASLVTGTNIIAVEIHQDSPSTPDARFDFELTASAVVPAERVEFFARRRQHDPVMAPRRGIAAIVWHDQFDFTRGVDARECECRPQQWAMECSTSCRDQQLLAVLPAASSVIRRSTRSCLVIGA